MNLSANKPFLTEIFDGSRIPESKIAYLEQRALNGFYDYVMSKFLDEKENSQLTKAKLAERIGRGPDQVNRWLSSPSNWTIGTVTRLLVGICGEEPILGSKSLMGRTAQNENWEAILSDEISYEDVKRPILPPRGGTTNPVETSFIRN